MKVSMLVIASFLMLSSCAKENSIFFPDCSCEKRDFSIGAVSTDSLGHYSAKFLESEWPVARNLDEFYNGLTWYNSNNNKLEAIAITKTNKGEKFVSAEEEITSFPFNQILDSGKIELLGGEHRWRLIEHEDMQIPYYSIYITMDYEEVTYTINLTVEKEKNYKVKFCELENFLEHIEIHDKKAF